MKEEINPLVHQYAVRPFNLFDTPEFKTVLKALRESPELAKWCNESPQSKIDAMVRDVLLNDKDRSISRRYGVDESVIKRLKQSLLHEIAMTYKGYNANIHHGVYEFLENGAVPLDEAIRDCITTGRTERLPKLFEQRLKFAELQAKFVGLIRPESVHNHNSTTYNQQLNVAQPQQAQLPTNIPSLFLNLPQKVETPKEVVTAVMELAESDE